MYKLLLIGMVTLFASKVFGDTVEWNLQKCIDQALSNNLQIQRLKLAKSNTALSYQEAKASQLPSVDGSIGYSLSPDINNSDSIRNLTQSGNYSLNASWAAFKGNSIRNDIKIKQLETEQSEVTVKSQEIKIIQEVTSAYLQVFYSNEAFKTSKISRDASKIQRDRTAGLLEAGSASKVDLARMDASLATDEYNLVLAANSLRSKERALKSLMEIPIDTPVVFYFPDLSDSLKTDTIPDIKEIYTAALEKMPGIENYEIDRQIASLGIKKAMAGFFPSLNVSAGLSTNNRNGSSSFSDQAYDNVNLKFGASLSIPIYDNRRTKTSVEKAKISVKDAELSLQQQRKALLEEVENIYYDAVAARSRLDASVVQYEKSLQSYQIAQEQFKLGMINSTDLLVEKNNYLVALREQLESKINVLMTMQMINIYMGIPVKL